MQEDYGAVEFAGRIAFRIEEKSAERVIGRMPVTGDMLNPFGTIHAGALLWLADVVATVLAMGDAEIGADGKGFPLAIDLHASLLANQRGGEVTAEAAFVRRGRRVSVVRTRVLGDDGRPLLETTTTHIPA